MSLLLRRITPRPPEVIATDTFTRPDSTSSLGTSDTGQPWTAYRGTFGINANRGYCVNVVGGWSGAGIDIGRTSYSYTLTYQGARMVAFRMVDADNCLAVDCGDGGNIILYHRSAGSFSPLAQASGITVSNGDVMQVSVGSSNLIQVTKNGAAVLSATSAEFASSTVVGVLTNTNGMFDDLIVRSA